MIGQKKIYVEEKCILKKWKPTKYFDLESTGAVGVVPTTATRCLTVNLKKFNE